jgi:predicted dehydrogenase
MTLRIGLIGHGHWGTNLARAAARTPGCVLAAIADLDPANRARAAAAHPDVPVTDDPAILVADPGIDALMIATPAGSHVALATQALDAGKHVLVTKPLAPTAVEAEALGRLATARGRVLLVDHTFVWAPPVTAIRGRIAAGDLGPLVYIQSERAGLGIFKDDVSVIEDLAIHDFAIFDHLLDRMPARVSATTATTHPGLNPSAAWISLFYPDGLVAQVAAHWLAPVKVRRMTVAGRRRILTWDDLDPVARLRLHDAGADPVDRAVPGRAALAYRTGPVTPLPLEAIEPLAAELAEFRDAVAGTIRPRADARAAARVARVCDAAVASAMGGGAPVAVDGAEAAP